MWFQRIVIHAKDYCVTLQHFYVSRHYEIFCRYHRFTGIGYIVQSHVFPPHIDLCRLFCTVGLTHIVLC